VPKVIDLTGERFGRLTVIKRVDNDKWGHHRWLCLCNCGDKTVSLGNDLKRGYIKSCGCFNREIHTKHGYTKNKNKTGFYQSWQAMIHRCTNPNNKQWKDYDGRGITVCKEWMEFQNFLRDMGNRFYGCSLERRDNEKGYYPENCYWATRSQQQRNTRRNHLISCFGKRQCIKEWSEETGISTKTIIWRLNHGWSSTRTLTTSTGKRKNGANR